MPWHGVIPSVSGVSVGTGIVLDTETTGLNSDTDVVIEIGIRVFRYDMNGRVLDVVGQYDAFNDPGRPLPEKIVELTGLTDAHVAGQKIDIDAVASLLQKSDVVIAHNAAFDKKFVHKLCAGRSVDRKWRCSNKLIDWKAHGLMTQKLEMLSLLHGFYTTAHRAGSDAEALLYLLSMTNAETERTYLHELLNAPPRVLVRAWNSPFHTKDKLKERGYHWDADTKVWGIEIPVTKQDDEIVWLRANVGGSPRVEEAE